MQDRAADLLRTRVARLDEGRLPVVEFPADRRLLRFILVMTSYTNTTFAGVVDGQPVLSPSDADELVASCHLLTDIARNEPTLVSGPVDHGRQQWIGTHRPSASSTPSRSRLIVPDDRTAPSTKPFDTGLYTSTSTANGRGMWRTYLDTVRGSDLHPLPWHSWHLRADDDVSVLEIASAGEWADFVGAYPRAHRDMIHPNWRGVASDFDGVHVTLRAIAAIQGFAFLTPHGPSAPAYWDVESTLWLRWCFRSVDQDEVVELGPDIS